MFIDSTHVSKIDSDVNYLIHTILPNLNKGVYIHFHDIMYPFEYPETWVFDGIAWNESYILRSFLQFNHCFEIVLWNNFIKTKFDDILSEEMPLFAGGGSIWIKKIK